MSTPTTPAGPVLTCINCCTNLIALRLGKRSSISSRLSGTPPAATRPTIYEALTATFDQNLKPMTPPKSSKDELRYICSPCKTLLTKAHSALTAFKDRTNPQSYIRSKINVRDKGSEGEPKLESLVRLEIVTAAPTVPAPVAVCTPTKQTSVSVAEMIQKYKANERYRTAFHNVLKRLINQEMKGLEIAAQSRFTAHELLDTNVLENELRTSAPILFATLSGACNKKQHTPVLTPAMQTVVGIMLPSRNQKCNYFHKMVGFALFKGQASMKTINILHKMQLCCSYTTIYRNQDSLNNDFSGKLCSLYDDWNKTETSEVDIKIENGPEKEQSVLQTANVFTSTTQSDTELLFSSLISEDPTIKPPKIARLTVAQRKTRKRRKLKDEARTSTD